MDTGTRNYPGLGDYPGLAPVAVEYDSSFYVGPIGRLRALPSTNDKVDTPLTAVGGTHTSLTGAFTRDIFGFKRSWTWSYTLLTDRQAQYVEAISRGLVAGPLYLIDPRRPNRLPEQIASGGSLLRTTTGFIPSNTTNCLWRPLNGVPPNASTLPMAPILRGCLEWQLLAAGGAGLELAGFAADGRHNVPVLPREALRVSLWAAGPPAAAITGTVMVYDTHGTLMNATTLPVTQLSLTSWQEAGVAFVAPDNAAYLRLLVQATSDSPIGSIYTTAYQVARYDPTYVPGLQQFCDEPDFGGWWIGGGAPQVVPDVGSSSYALPGLQSSGLTLTERSFAGTMTAKLPALADNNAPDPFGGAQVSQPDFATRWVAGALDGTTGATDSWQSATPVVATNANFVLGKALNISLPADGSSTPGGTAAAPGAGSMWQRCEQYMNLTGITGVDVNNEIGPGFTGYFGISVYLDTDFPVNPRTSTNGQAWQLISQWKNDGAGTPPCELNIQGGRLSLGGNSGTWTIDICAVYPGNRYDIILGLTFAESSAASSASVWVNDTQYVSGAHPTNGGFLYSGQRSYWKVGIYRESGDLTAQARASAWYGAVCFDPSQAVVASYLTNT